MEREILESDLRDWLRCPVQADFCSDRASCVMSRKSRNLVELFDSFK